MIVGLDYYWIGLIGAFLLLVLLGTYIKTKQNLKLTKILLKL